MQLERVLVDDFYDVVNVRVFVSVVVVILHVVDARMNRSPMHMQVEHFVQWELRKIGVRIDKQIRTRCHFCFAKMHALLIFCRIGPAQVVVPAVSSNISKHSSAMTFAG